MKRIIFFAFVYAFSFADLTAQEETVCKAYYPFEEQTTLTYSHYDKKGKLESKNINTVTVVEDIDGGLEAQIISKILDKSEEAVSEHTFKVICDGNGIKMDLSNLMSPKTTEAFSNFEVTMSGDPLLLPNDLKEGMELPDASNLIEADTGPINLKMTMNATNRKVEAKETIETEAGSFETYRISYNMSIKTIIKSEFKIVEWYAKDIGLVKSEMYSLKDKLKGSTVLTALN